MTEKAIRKHVKNALIDADLESLTPRMVRESVANAMGCSSAKVDKKMLKQILGEEIAKLERGSASSTTTKNSKGKSKARDSPSSSRVKTKKVKEEEEEEEEEEAEEESDDNYGDDDDDDDEMGSCVSSSDQDDDRPPPKRRKAVTAKSKKKTDSDAESRVKMLRSCLRKCACTVPLLKGVPPEEQFARLKDLARENGIQGDPLKLSTKAIAAHKARIEQSKELAELDTSLILDSTSRRSRRAVPVYVPPVNSKKAKKDANATTGNSENAEAEFEEEESAEEDPSSSEEEFEESDYSD